MFNLMCAPSLFVCLRSLTAQDQADAEAITGFIRNAVTVVGARAPLPIYLSHHIAELSSGHFWLGGGAVRHHHPTPRASL